MAPERALAQTSEAALAESLFEEARERLAEGSLDAACAKFKASQELDPQLGTLLNLGQCYERQGKTASAWAVFAELSRLARRAGQARRAEYAAERVTALAPELAYLTLRHANRTPGTVVRIDGKPLSDGALGSALPLDPGPHRVEVTAPGFRAQSRTVVIAAKTRRVVDLPALIPVPEGPPLATNPSRPPLSSGVLLSPSAAAPPAGDASPSPWWTPAIVGYSVAGAAAIVGTATGGLALAAGGDLDCPANVCPPEQSGTLSRANTLGDVANVAFAVAGAGAILGVVATIMALSDDGADEGASAHRPRAGVFFF
ncbi:MAG: hypothetical protein AAGN82_23940 [Myxococcota bacterium]